jgi:hypothetical protein
VYGCMVTSLCSKPQPQVLNAQKAQATPQEMIKLKLLHQHRGENHHTSTITMRSTQDTARDADDNTGPQALADINGNAGVRQHVDWFSTVARLALCASCVYNTTVIVMSCSDPLQRYMYKQKGTCV